MKQQSYHEQKRGDVTFQNVSMSFSIDIFCKLPNNNQHCKKYYVVRGLI